VLDHNPWKDLVFGGAGIALQVVGYVIVVTTLIVGIYKLWSFVRIFGWELSVSQVCLWLDIAACISLLNFDNFTDFVVRLIFLVDPFGFYSIFAIQYSAVILSLSSPFSLASVLLIAFYWCSILLC
jgi:hypothetical protein